MTDEAEALRAARSALSALYIEVDASIADDVSRLCEAVFALLPAPVPAGAGDAWNDAIEASAKIARDRAWEHENEAERLYAKHGEALSHHDAGVHKLQSATAATINNDILALKRPAPPSGGMTEGAPLHAPTLEAAAKAVRASCGDCKGTGYVTRAQEAYDACGYCTPAMESIRALAKREN